MESLDLAALSLDELKALQTKVAKAIETYEDRRRKEAAAELEAQAKALGFTLAELSDFSKKTKAALPPKYRHPSDPDLTWSGRGRKPGWIKDAEDSGKSLDDFLIA